MLKHIHIVGNLGGMGRRYTAILKYLGVEKITGSDLNSKDQFSLGADGHIIATPTSTHLEVMSRILANTRSKILCEKPFTTDLVALTEFESENESELERLTMVNQYLYVDKEESDCRYTSYNYFKHGDDSLAWDCINVIAASRNDIVYLNEDSPIWDCVINGSRILPESMDTAYIKMVSDWLRKAEFSKGNWPYAKNAHEKVEKWLSK